MKSVDWKRLETEARKAAAKAYCPYSHFRVGAALLTSDNVIISGCNIENASYGVTLCAERTALARAISQGHHSFSALALATDRSNPATPCGICRQMLSEFCSPGMPIHCVSLMDQNSPTLATTLGELLPHAFA